MAETYLFILYSRDGKALIDCGDDRLAWARIYDAVSVLAEQKPLRFLKGPTMVGEIGLFELTHEECVQQMDDDVGLPTKVLKMLQDAHPCVGWRESFSTEQFDFGEVIMPIVKKIQDHKISELDYEVLKVSKCPVWRRYVYLVLEPAIHNPGSVYELCDELVHYIESKVHNRALVVMAEIPSLDRIELEIYIDENLDWGMIF